MKKTKKILLSSISAIGLMTLVPIIATSCSVNSSLNSNSTTQKPQQPQNPNKPQDPNKPQKPSFSGDKTNSDNFSPINVGLYSEIIDGLWLVEGVKTEDKVDEVIDANKDNILRDDVENIINMWSFNNWNIYKKNLNSLSSMASKIVNLNVSNSDNSTIWEVSFDYEIELVTNDNTKIFVKKNYSYKGQAFLNVKFTTKKIEFKINDISQPDILNNNGILSKNIIEKVKDFINQSSSTFDIKEIFKTFLNNKNIKGVFGNWKEESLPKGATITNDDILNINLDLIDSDWNGFKKGMTQDQIENVFIDKKPKNSTKNAFMNDDSFESTVQLPIGNMKREFWKLVNDKKGIIGNIVITSRTVNNDQLEYTVSIIRTNYLATTNKLIFKNFKKDQI